MKICVASIKVETHKFLFKVEQMVSTIHDRVFSSSYDDKIGIVWLTPWEPDIHMEILHDLVYASTSRSNDTRVNAVIDVDILSYQILL